MKKLFALVSVAALAGGAWLFTGPSRPEAPKELLDRVWIDHVPKGPTDLVHHMLVLKEPQGPGVGGVVGASSQWRIGADLFQRKLGGDHMRMFFPQRNKAFVVNVKTWRCAGDVPEPFQLCLELSARDGKHKHRLYSRDDWVIDSSTLPEALRSLAKVPDVSGISAAGDVEDVTMEFDDLPAPFGLAPFSS